MEYLCYSGKTNFLFKNIKIPMPYFHKILSDYFEAVSYTHLDVCKRQAVTCTSVTKEQKKEQPPKLYDLTTLQREANRLFGYTAKQTLDSVSYTHLDGRMFPGSGILLLLRRRRFLKKQDLKPLPLSLIHI